MALFFYARFIMPVMMLALLPFMIVPVNDLDMSFNSGRFLVVNIFAYSARAGTIFDIIRIIPSSQI